MTKFFTVSMLAMLGLAACSQPQADKFTAQSDAAMKKVQAAVKIGCDVDGKFVPMAQGAVAVASPMVVAANAPAGGLVVGANMMDQTIVHPAVVKFCQSIATDAKPAAVAVDVPAATDAAKPAG